MAHPQARLDAVWNDVDRVLGQLFIMGWDQPYVSAPIHDLIRHRHVGAVLLNTQNLESADQTARLVHELQMIARDAGHPVPLLIALDQENGGVNSLFDEDYICQFPSAMGVAAAGDVDLAFDVAKATATELSAVGVNMILGPVLDVLDKTRVQALGARAASSDAQEASRYGLSAIRGFQDAGVAACGKHFPSYGNIDALSSSLDMPVIKDSLAKLSTSGLIPFANAINAGVDAVIVGGCAVANNDIDAMHACLSEQIVTDLLRDNLRFSRVVMSECLEMESLGTEIGIRGATVMAIEAGCDMILLCRSLDVQQEAMSGLKLGVETDIISVNRLRISLERILALKSRYTSWEKALHPPGLRILAELHPLHRALSKRAYDESITVVRDRQQHIPLASSPASGSELLVLTPLLKPLPTSRIARITNDETQEDNHYRAAERIFQDFGRALAVRYAGKIVHTSYTYNGLRPEHEVLVKRASTIIVFTADTHRNRYQYGFSKHIAALCTIMSSTGGHKPLVIVSVSSPADFAEDEAIGTYLCTYDFTENAMASLSRILFGETSPRGVLPGKSIRREKCPPKPRQNWLVERWNPQDAHALDALIQKTCAASTPAGTSLLECATAASFQLSDTVLEQQHYMIRNSSTKVIFGFCATYVYRDQGYIGALFVEPSKIKRSIGRSLFSRAVRDLRANSKITSIRIGIRYPGIFPGIPTNSVEGHRLCTWLINNASFQRTSVITHRYILRDLSSWTAPEGLMARIRALHIDFDLVQGVTVSENLATHIRQNASWESLELYRRALSASGTCRVVRASQKADGRIVGSVILYRSGSKLGTYQPLQQSQSQQSSGEVANPIISSDVEEGATLLHALLAWGIRQSRENQAHSLLLDSVKDIYAKTVTDIGFEMLHTFEELVAEPLLITNC